jgi:hypothetical protein
MILGFSTQLNGKPTYFVEKIWKGLKNNISKELYSELESKLRIEEMIKPYPVDIEVYKKVKSKITTIREDKTNRWKAGMMIDFFINVRKKNMFRFAPVLPVVRTQKIFITYTKAKKAIVHIDDKCFYMQGFSLEGNHKMLHLAQNDGFDTIEDFFAYFDKDYKGKIIHWTDLKY